MSSNVSSSGDEGLDGHVCVLMFLVHEIKGLVDMYEF